MRTTKLVLPLLLLSAGLAQAQPSPSDERLNEIKQLEAMLAKVDAALASLKPVVHPPYQLRLFDLRGLMLRPTDRPAPSLTIPGSSAGYRTASGAPSKGGGGALCFEECEEEGTILEPDKLQELIMNAIGEDRWDEPASIEVHRGSLFVRQTRPAQARIAKLIGDLKARQLRSMQLEVGFYALPAKVLSALQAEALKHDGVLSKAALARLDAAVAKQRAKLIRSAMLTALNEQRVYLHQGNERAFVSEFVQTSGGTGMTTATVADPVIKTLRSGLALDMRPTLVAAKSGTRVAMDVRFVQTRLLGVIRRATPWGAIDTPRVAVDSVRTSAKVASGEGMLVFSAQAAAPDDAKEKAEAVESNLTIIVRPRLVKTP